MIGLWCQHNTKCHHYPLRRHAPRYFKYRSDKIFLKDLLFPDLLRISGLFFARNRVSPEMSSRNWCWKKKPAASSVQTCSTNYPVSPTNQQHSISTLTIKRLLFLSEKVLVFWGPYLSTQGSKAPVPWKETLSLIKTNWFWNSKVFSPKIKNNSSRTAIVLGVSRIQI